MPCLHISEFSPLVKSHDLSVDNGLVWQAGEGFDNHRVTAIEVLVISGAEMDLARRLERDSPKAIEFQLDQPFVVLRKFCRRQEEHRINEAGARFRHRYITVYPSAVCIRNPSLRNWERFTLAYPAPIFIRLATSPEFIGLPTLRRSSTVRAFIVPSVNFLPLVIRGTAGFATGGMTPVSLTAECFIGEAPLRLFSLCDFTPLRPAGAA